ncbi:MAG: hypothetical protein IPK04_21610 [Bdellovibrionales bacterium]|nr:hypothetical protein [Bdellovibrionales bacterium]
MLAEYYQTLLTSHAFVFTNQSLYMNQVNYLLKLNGFTPLYHGVIDFWSMTLQKEEFKRFFIDEVIEQHSGEFLLH